MLIELVFSRSTANHCQNSDLVSLIHRTNHTGNQKRVAWGGAALRGPSSQRRPTEVGHTATAHQESTNRLEMRQPNWNHDRVVQVRI